MATQKTVNECVDTIISLYVARLESNTKAVMREIPGALYSWDWYHKSEFISRKEWEFLKQALKTDDAGVSAHITRNAKFKYLVGRADPYGVHMAFDELPDGFFCVLRTAR